jgi:acyl-CoA thioesterase FadM
MSDRVRISLPKRWDFATSLTVRVSDLNYGAHLGNDRVLALMHEVRVRWLTQLGWTELDLANSGVGWIQTDAAVQYKGEAFAGDVLRGELAVEEISRRGFALVYRLTRESDGAEIARGSTNLLCFDYKKRALAHTPEAVFALLEQRRAE